MSKGDKAGTTDARGGGCADTGRSNPPEMGGDCRDDDYGITVGKSDQSEQSDPRQSAGFADLYPDTEVADPDHFDHDARRATRIAPEYRDTESLPNPLVECGCGDCPDRVDPLADEIDGAFDDVLDRNQYAADECPDPRPVTVERAAQIYRAYQSAAHRHNNWTSRLERVENQHGRLMDAERDLLAEWGDSVTTALLSLRLPPIEPAEGGDADTDSTEADYYGITLGKQDPLSGDGDGATDTARRWIPPTQVDDRLHDPWRQVYDSLAYHLDGYQWEYLWVVGATDSAATPHLHVYLWIRDPDDEITVDHVRPAVESFVSNAPSARPEDHPVEAGESDAAVVETTPTMYDAPDDEQLLYIDRQVAEREFQLNTAGLAYCLNQRPDWALRRILDGQSTFADERVALEGAAIAWASPNDWIGISQGLPT